MKYCFRHYSLTIVMFSLFLLFWGGQTVVGYHVCNDEREEAGQPTLSPGAYLTSGHFLEATAENWESEFLQMAAFIWLTSCLFQVGSPESQNPDEPEKEPSVTADSPWPARKGGWVKTLYGYSLSLAFFAMFLVCIALHAWGGSIEYSREQAAHGKPAVGVLQYFCTAQFWFESLQNWQSEFLAIASMVVLSIFLRQKNSPESKSVAAPIWANE